MRDRKHKVGSGEKKFRTLRGFLSGDEPDEEDSFAYSATLRIFGESLDFGEISRQLALEATSFHRRGEKKGPQSPTYLHDMWMYKPPIAEERPLAEHIDALWADIKQSKKYLLSLKRVATVDVFLGYRSNVDYAGVEVPHTCLEMFVELQVPFGLSIIIV